MRKHITFALFGFLFTSCTFFTDTKVDSQKSSFYYYSPRKKKIVAKYARSVFGIPAGEVRIEMDADPLTFSVIDNKMAKDKDHIYIGSRKISNVDVESFRLFQNELYIDKNHLYSYRIIDEEAGILQVIEGANVNEYIKLDYAWGKDNKSYFYLHKKIDVDFPSFIIVNKYLAYDKSFIYNTIDYDTLSKLSKSGDIKFINSNVCYDQNHILYTEGKRFILPVKNVGSLHVYDSINPVLFKVDNKVYWNGNDLSSLRVDAGTFESLNKSFAKDKNQIYYNGEVVCANTKNFAILGNEVSKDADFVYFRSSIVNDVDPATVKIIESENEFPILTDKNGKWTYNRARQEWRNTISK